LKVIRATLSEAGMLAAFIWKAWKRAGPDAFGWTGATEEGIRDLADRKTLEAIIGRPHSWIFIAVDGSNAVGFCASRKLDEETAELAGIVVLQDMLGRGIGTELLEAAKQSALQEGFKRIVVKTEASNERAIAFYERRGFALVRDLEENVREIRARLKELALDLPGVARTGASEA